MWFWSRSRAARKAKAANTRDHGPGTAFCRCQHMTPELRSRAAKKAKATNTRDNEAGTALCRCQHMTPELCASGDGG
eukprot:jgi/Tetstr1/458783/TSEL_045167.t1